MLYYSIIWLRDFNVYFAFFCFSVEAKAHPQWYKAMAWHKASPINASLDVQVLIVTAYQSQFETIQEVFSKGVVC